MVSFLNMIVGTNDSRNDKSKRSKAHPASAMCGAGKRTDQFECTPFRNRSLFWEKAIGSLANLEIYFLAR